MGKKIPGQDNLGILDSITDSPYETGTIRSRQKERIHRGTVRKLRFGSALHREEQCLNPSDVLTKPYRKSKSTDDEADNWD